MYFVLYDTFLQKSYNEGQNIDLNFTHQLDETEDELNISFFSSWRSIGDDFIIDLVWKQWNIQIVQYFFQTSANDVGIIFLHKEVYGSLISHQATFKFFQWFNIAWFSHDSFSGEKFCGRVQFKNQIFHNNGDVSFAKLILMQFFPIKLVLNNLSFNGRSNIFM